jgi:hypothetical protein
MLDRLLVSDDFRRPAAFEGTVARDVADEGDLMMVTLRDFDEGRQLFGPCPWMPRNADLPLRGDRCLIVFSDWGDPWVVAWLPA